MTAPITHLICGCTSTHKAGCVLGEAEEVAYLAAAEAEGSGHHGLLAVLHALDDCGLLCDIDAVTDDKDNALASIRDVLFELGVVGRKS